MQNSEIANTLKYKFEINFSFKSIQKRTDNNNSFNQGFHYACIIERNGIDLEFEYTKGRGHKGIPPSIDEVVWSLLMDKTEETFKNWCSEYGYIDGSISTLKIYNECIKHSEFIDDIFSSDEINELYEIFSDY